MPRDTARRQDSAVDSAAIIIASISLAIAVVGQSWQLTLYILSGARLRVRLVPALMTHRGTLTRGGEGGWPSRLPDDASPQDGDLWAEVAEIAVANIGRTTVWVSQIGLDFGRDAGFTRRSRTIMTIPPLAILGGLADNAPTRLEPGQDVVMYVPLIDSVEWAQKKRSHGATVRATASQAGRRAKRSSWQRAWRLRKGQSPRFPHTASTRQVVLFQELLNSWPSGDVAQLYEAWLAAWNAMENGPDTSNLANALEPYFKGPMQSHMLAMRLRQKLLPGPSS